MSDIEAEWKFRGLIYSLSQKRDANGRAKIRRELAAMLRSDYSLSRDDQSALAEHFEDGKAGRTRKQVRPPSPPDKIVTDIRAIQSAEGCTLKRAIAAYMIKRSFVVGSDKAAAEWAKYEDQVKQELNRSRSASKNRG